MYKLSICSTSKTLKQSNKPDEKSLTTTFSSCVSIYNDHYPVYKMNDLAWVTWPQLVFVSWCNATVYWRSNCLFGCIQLNIEGCLCLCHYLWLNGTLVLCETLPYQVTRKKWKKGESQLKVFFWFPAWKRGHEWQEALDQMAWVAVVRQKDITFNTISSHLFAVECYWMFLPSKSCTFRLANQC